LQKHYGIKIYYPQEDFYLIAYQQLLYDLTDFKPDVQFKDTLEVDGFKIKVIPTPGHTKGSSCLLIDNNLFSGDMLFADGYLGRTDLWGGSAEQIQESLAKLMLLAPDTVVYPGHGPSSTIRQERKNHGR